MADPLWLLLIGMVVVLGGILALRLNAFLALVLGALIVATVTPRAGLEQYAKDKSMSPAETQTFVKRSIGERVAGEFGRTCATIGILIAMASIVGKCLLESGGAERIVRSTLKLVGERRAPLAFLSSGFTLGIPVFFDTVFYLMIPLGKAMAMRNVRDYGLYIMTIIAGATMTHSLVPPTPGPLFVAGELSIGLDQMIVGGIVVGFFCAASGYVYARWANRRWAIPLRDSADISREELEALTKREESELPPFWLSLSPIALPVALITGKTVLASVSKGFGSGTVPGWLEAVGTCFNYAGDPNVAMTLSAAIALATVVAYRRADREMISRFVQMALSSAGMIILITSAGGAFGGILQQTGIGHRIQELSSAYRLGALPLAFAVTALIRTAQGSATVAMITAVGILGSMASSGQIGFHPLYLALAIGCGSKPVPWMNDSGFWVICKMSGMTEAETLKTASTMMSLMGITGLFVIMIAAHFFPLV